jgi:hypothetical protein
VLPSLLFQLLSGRFHFFFLSGSQGSEKCFRYSEPTGHSFCNLTPSTLSQLQHDPSSSVGRENGAFSFVSESSSARVGCMSARCLEGAIFSSNTSSPSFTPPPLCDHTPMGAGFLLYLRTKKPPPCTLVGCRLHSQTNLQSQEHIVRDLLPVGRRA